MTRQATTSSLVIDEAIKQGCTLIGTLAENPRLEAEIFLANAIGKSRTYLHTWPERIVEPYQVETYFKCIRQRAAGTPVAYVLGRREFWSLQLEVNADTLIPRPETELLVELALDRIEIDANWIIADLGTGSGAIALAMAVERPQCQFLGVDNSSAALEIANRNAANLQIDNIQFILGDWTTPLGIGKTQMIVSNPPYVRDQDPHLHQGDVRFEPRSALSSGNDGLRDIKLIAAAAGSYLTPGGSLLFEHGYDQGKAVRGILNAKGYSGIQTYRDLTGHERVSAAILE